LLLNFKLENGKIAGLRFSYRSSTVAPPALHLRFRHCFQFLVAGQIDNNPTHVKIEFQLCYDEVASNANWPPPNRSEHFIVCGIYTCRTPSSVPSLQSL